VTKPALSTSVKASESLVIRNAASCSLPTVPTAAGAWGANFGETLGIPRENCPNAADICDDANWGVRGRGDLQETLKTSLAEHGGRRRQWEVEGKRQESAHKELIWVNAYSIASLYNTLPGRQLFLTWDASIWESSLFFILAWEGCFSSFSSWKLLLIT